MEPQERAEPFPGPPRWPDMTDDRKRKAGSRLNPVIHPVLLGMVIMALFLTWFLILR